MDNTARNYIDHVERDLLEAKHLLQSGLEIALERVGSMAQITRTAMTDQAIGKLRALEDLSEKDSKDEAENLRRNLAEKVDEALKAAKAKDAETLGSKLLGISHYLASNLGDNFKILFGFSH